MQHKWTWNKQINVDIWIQGITAKQQQNSLLNIIFWFPFDFEYKQTKQKKKESTE